jgi:hypothetical protein
LLHRAKGGEREKFIAHDAQFMRHFTFKHSKTFEYVNNNNIPLFVAAVFVFPLNCFLRAAKKWHGKEREEKLLKETI